MTCHQHEVAEAQVNKISNKRIECLEKVQVVAQESAPRQKAPRSMKLLALGVAYTTNNQAPELSCVLMQHVMEANYTL
jgi:hypothetical protein